MEGFYSVYFTGAHGSGYAVFIMQNGVIAGADPGGGSFDGHYIYNNQTETYDGTITMSAPPGMMLVTGAQVGQKPIKFPIPIRLPNDFENGQVVRLETPTGAINVAFHKIRELA